jgi:hypothetical protein
MWALAPFLVGGCAMALYRCSVAKRGVEAPYLGQRWRNVYTIEAATYGAALAAADVLAGHEMVFHTDKVLAYEVTAHLVTEPPRRVGAQLGIDRLGEYAPVGDPWPLWNTVRVTWADVGVGRPESKYYRVGLHDGMVDAAMQLLGTYKGIVLGEVAVMATLTNFVGPSGEAHASYNVQDAVQMRQLGWHRRRRPGFVRGYVPV